MERLNVSLTKDRGVFVVSALFVFVFAGCGPDRKDAPVYIEPVPTAKETPSISYSVVAKHGHDSTAYTEGFLFHNGKLFESTGAPSHLPQTRSAIGIIDLKTGKFDKKVEIDREKYFGEGIQILGNLLYQLTYTNQIGFIYDLKTFNCVGQFGYTNKEGWGMTTDSTHLIFSDGTCNLTYMTPGDFRIVKTIPVVENGYGVNSINELEFINGFIYANIWLTNKIIKIEPESGEVVGVLDLSKLVDEVKKTNKNLNELNGIAYDPVNDRILVTGKLWPYIYEINFPH